MWGKLCGAFVATAIAVTILSIAEVDSRSTANGGVSRETATLDEAVKELFRQVMSKVEDLRVVNLIRKDLEDVKNALTQQQNNVSCIFEKDLDDLKAAFDASAQYRNATDISKKLEDLKAAFDELTQQLNASSISKKLKDLNDAFNASIHQPNNETRKDLQGLKGTFDTLSQQLNASNIIKQLEDIKAAFDTSIQQHNASGISKKLEDLKTAFDESTQQHCISKKDVKDLKAALTSIMHQQCPLTRLPTSKQVFVFSLTCEYRTCHTLSTTHSLHTIQYNLKLQLGSGSTVIIDRVGFSVG